MSLTSHIHRQTPLYWYLVSLLNLPLCQELINHHRKICGPVIHRPVPATNFPLVGMSVIYAVRDFLGGKTVWEDTIAGDVFAYPGKSETPLRWVVMGLMDEQARRGEYQGHPGDIHYLPTDFTPTIEDVGQIASSFNSIFQRAIPSDNGAIADKLVVNPRFAGSNHVQGADANLILGNTLWDIRTTARFAPLSLDDIVQQVGYFLLDFDNRYELEDVCWYYSRQQSLFTHPIQPLLIKEASGKFQNWLLGQATRPTWDVSAGLSNF